MSGASLKMRQSLATFEEELSEQMQAERQRSELQFRRAVVRSRKRHVEKRKKRSSKRFWTLVASLVITAVVVTIAMFETLYLLLG